MKRVIRFSSLLVISLLAMLWFQACTSTNKVSLNYASRSIASEDLDQPWAYDSGPLPDNKMGKELIDLVAQQPFMPGISKEIAGDQKFRPAFGPTLWRMVQKPNSVKILFIGQDGTHIAEAAGRTATAGFGGRAQDLAAYFGVNNGAAFINTFAFTIRGQYAAFQTPFVTEKDGVKRVSVGTVIENGTWLMSQDQNSPMVMWRNSLIDWIIRNNSESLKMIVLFGGSARDSLATYIESRGGKVGSRYTEQDLKEFKVQVPVFNLESAGSNKEFSAVLDRQGKELYPQIVGRRLDYSKEEDQKTALDTLTKNIDRHYKDIAFTNSGLAGSGLIHPAQIGGYDLDKIQVNGKTTLSLRGLTLSDGSTVKEDILVADFPHPTSLSMMTPQKASETIASSLKSIQPYVREGWKIQADPNMTNEFSMGRPYKYGRTDIGPAYYDFGTPKNRMVSVSSASRMSGKPNVIVIGTRERAMFDNRAIEAASRFPRPAGISDDEMFTARPRSATTRYVFDPGPGEEMARIMKENLDLKVIGAVKKGMNPKQVGISAYNIKTHPEDVGDFGHYRGTFQKPRVVILADPDGADDILTSRALTGARGQYIHSLMDSMGVKDQYLVLKTVPFGMDGAQDSEWKTVLEQTSQYREKIFQALFASGKPELLVSDGRFAEGELKRIATSFGIPIVAIQRQGSDNDFGLKEAATEISKISAFRNAKFDGQMKNIPRSHLGFMSRVWEGTSGTRVFDATSAADKGTAFAIVAPEWSFKNEAIQSPVERKNVENLKKILDVNRLPKGGEKFQEFKKRMGIRDNTNFKFNPKTFDFNYHILAA